MRYPPPVDFGLFFQGKLAREEVASALIGTFLQWDAQFRTAFLGLLPAEVLGDADRARCAEARWTVRVEDDAVDLTMESPDHDLVILIENKVRSGSQQVGQLLRYYEARVAREERRRIIAVYLAPRGSGAIEVDRVRARLRAQDRALLLSWDDVLPLGEALAPHAPNRSILITGLRDIDRDIKAAQVQTFPNVGAREDVRALMERVRENLEARLTRRGQNVALVPWRTRNWHEILTAKTPVMLSVDACFEARDEPPFEPIGVMEGGRLNLTLQTIFAVAAAARKKPAMKAWWAEQIAHPVQDVDGDRYELDPKRGFVFLRKVSGTSEELTEVFAATFDRLLIRFARELST